MKIDSIMKILIIIGIVFSLSTPASADKISITLSDTSLDFGNATADGSTYFLSRTIQTDSTTNINLYVKASGPLTDGIDIIALNPNFKYDFNNTGSFTPFSTSNVKVVSNWNRGPSGKDPPININYGLTVPVGTPVGNYTNTITYTAVATYSPAPASTNTSTNSLVDNSTGTNSLNDTNTTNLTSGTGNIISFIDILLELL